MKTIRNWCSAISCMLLVAIISSLIGGVFGAIKGYRLGKDDVCDDLAFYYNNDMPLKGCPGSVIKAKNAR